MPHASLEARRTDIEPIEAAVVERAITDMMSSSGMVVDGLRKILGEQ